MNRIAKFYRGGMRGWALVWRRTGNREAIGHAVQCREMAKRMGGEGVGE